MFGRNTPEIVTARALAPLPALLGLASPWLEAGARGLFQKGRDYRSRKLRKALNMAFDLVEHRSMVDPESVVLEIRNLRRRHLSIFTATSPIPANSELCASITVMKQGPPHHHRRQSEGRSWKNHDRDQPCDSACGDRGTCPHRRPRPAGQRQHGPRHRSAGSQDIFLRCPDCRLASVEAAAVSTAVPSLSIVPVDP